MSSVTDVNSEFATVGDESVKQNLEQLTQRLQGGQGGGRVSEALGGLVDSIQVMVRQMRNEQEFTREQLNAQDAQQKEILQLLRKMSVFFDKAANE